MAQVRRSAPQQRKAQPTPARTAFPDDAPVPKVTSAVQVWHSGVGRQIGITPNHVR